MNRWLALATPVLAEIGGLVKAVELLVGHVRRIEALVRGTDVPSVPRVIDDLDDE